MEYNLQTKWHWTNDIDEPGLPSPPRHIGVQCNVMEDSEIIDAVSYIHKEMGQPPSILVNAAGITKDNLLLRAKKETDISPILQTNLIGTMTMTQVVVKNMIKYGTKGSIINVGSIVGGSIGSPAQSM